MFSKFHRAVMGMAVLMVLVASSVQAATYTMKNSQDRSGEEWTLQVNYPGTPGNHVTRTFSHLNLATYDKKILVVKPSGSLTTITPTPTNFTTVPIDAHWDSLVTPMQWLNGTLAGSWGDCDNDGDLDLPLYQNNGSSFGDLPGFRSLISPGNYHGGSWCDYDKDGDLDLALLAYNYDSTTNYRTRLFRNDGQGVFTDVAPAFGMDLIGRGETAVWGDLDGNGWPDLFAPYHDHNIPGILLNRSFLYMNYGGTFIEEAVARGVDLSNPNQQSRPEGADAIDQDNDGDLDLYTGGHLFINNGTGHFVDMAAAVGLPQLFDEGNTFIDYDNDGDWDQYVRYYTGGPVDGPHLWRNDAGHYTDVTTQAGVGLSSFFWGDAWADVNNDGFVDLLQVEYFWDGVPWINHLRMNNGNGTFRADTINQVLHGMFSFADIDHDGDLDLDDAFDPPTVYTNRFMQEDVCRQGSALMVRVLDAQGRMTQHRATVKLWRTTPSNDPLSQTRAVGGGATYLSENDYDTFFGLGNRGTVTRNPNLPAYNFGQPVVLTAIPNPGYRFSSWTGDATGSQNPKTIIMNGNKNIKAKFVKQTFGLMASSAESEEEESDYQLTVKPSEFEFSLTTIQPNPVRHGNLSVQFSLAPAGAAKLELFDISGRRVYVNNLSNLDAGPHTQVIRTRGLAPGVYLMHLTQGEHQQTQRVMILS